MQRKLDFFCYLFCAKLPEVDMLGPQHDDCVSDSMLHGTVLITNFSVL